jgi:hypothetical protein
MEDKPYQDLVLQGLWTKEIEIKENYEVKPANPYYLDFYQKHQAEIESFADKVRLELFCRSEDSANSKFASAFIQEFRKDYRLTAELLRDKNSPVHQLCSLDVVIGILAFQTKAYRAHREEIEAIKKIPFEELFFS